jgi:hypothetical protein
MSASLWRGVQWLSGESSWLSDCGLTRSFCAQTGKEEDEVLDLDPVASFFTLVVALACILASQFWDHILRSLKRLMLFLKHFVSETALAKAGLNRGKD